MEGKTQRILLFWTLSGIGFLFFFVVFLSFSPTASAENSTIRIACIIPEIPGKNVAVIEEHATLPLRQTIDEQKKEISPENSYPLLFQKETREKVERENTILLVTTQTVYSR